MTKRQKVKDILFSMIQKKQEILTSEKLETENGEHFCLKKDDYHNPVHTG